MPFGIVDQPGALAAEIGVDRMQRVPQLARWRGPRATAALALEDMHDLADPLDREPGTFGLAVPNPPAQALNLGDDHRFRLHPTRLVGRQYLRRLLGALEPHGDVKPVEDWQARDTGIGQNGPQTRATIGECGQLRVAGSAQGLKVSADQHCDIGLGPRNSTEHLPASIERLDVADANLL